ncbi:MAG: hypothetical protein OXU21_03205 [Chloroflexota bacterium]|nr:hypothetical protein [Chloroflexota bacterium]
MTTADRISKSWNVRRELVRGILAQGDRLIDAMTLVPETSEGTKVTMRNWGTAVQ